MQWLKAVLATAANNRHILRGVIMGGGALGISFTGDSEQALANVLTAVLALWAAVESLVWGTQKAGVPTNSPSTGPTVSSDTSTSLWSGRSKDRWLK